MLLKTIFRFVNRPLPDVINKHPRVWVKFYNQENQRFWTDVIGLFLSFLRDLSRMLNDSCLDKNVGYGRSRYISRFKEICKSGLRNVCIHKTETVWLVCKYDVYVDESVGKSLRICKRMIFEISQREELRLPWPVWTPFSINPQTFKLCLSTEQGQLPAYSKLSIQIYGQQ